MSSSFYIAPFALDGELAGLGSIQFSDLSPRWLNYFTKFLSENSSKFDTTFPPPFERIRLRFTSLRGAALTTLSVDGIPVASSALLSGENSSTENAILRDFVTSLQSLDAVKQSERDSTPFEQAFSILERPIWFIVVWGTEQEKDSDIIRELNTHFAAAFFHTNTAEQGAAANP
jgi:hypothetical protein